MNEQKGKERTQAERVTELKVGLSACLPKQSFYLFDWMWTVPSVLISARPFLIFLS